MVRTVAVARATLGEHNPNLQTSRVKQEPFAMHSGKSTRGSTKKNQRNVKKSTKNITKRKYEESRKIVVLLYDHKGEDRPFHSLLVHLGWTQLIVDIQINRHATHTLGLPRLQNMDLYEVLLAKAGGWHEQNLDLKSINVNWLCALLTLAPNPNRMILVPKDASEFAVNLQRILNHLDGLLFNLLSMIWSCEWPTARKASVASWESQLLSLERITVWLWAISNSIKKIPSKVQEYQWKGSTPWRCQLQPSISSCHSKRHAPARCDAVTRLRHLDAPVVGIDKTNWGTPVASLSSETTCQ